MKYEILRDNTNKTIENYLLYCDVKDTGIGISDEN